jgi:hypothetical protein
MTTKKLLIAATVLSGLALFAMGASGLAQDNLGKQGQDPQPRKPKAQIPSSVHLFNYGDFDKQCVAWTDGCRTCIRNTDQPPTCSNIGIACQPKQTITCTRQP